MRAFEFLLSKANGRLSFVDAPAAVDLDAGDVAYIAPAVIAGDASTVGTAVVTDASVAGLDGHTLFVTVDGDVEHIDFAAAGINTRAEFKTALEALTLVMATIDGDNHVTIDGIDGADFSIDVSNAAVTAAIGIPNGLHEAPVARPAGYVLFENGLSDELKKTIAIIVAPVLARQGATGVARFAEYNPNHVTFPAGTEAEAKAALEARFVIPG
jgi:hypothetical protein